MPEPQKLCVVNDTMTITRHDPVIVTSRWEGGALKAGDWIELRSTVGEHCRAQIRSFVMPARNSEPFTIVGGFYSLMLAHIDRGLIRIGDEVWSAAEPPEKMR